ncbi:MAG TPA: dockerin type I domain-containing protein [Tepidisphaeraceae bacterium]|jgi:hypothetical protein|nr:dockerin type I domain-containing protein [Tepidisphaeraceae bacterium]
MPYQQRYSRAILSSAIIASAILPASLRADPILLSPGVTYIAGAGTFYSSDFSFQGGTLHLGGTSSPPPTQFLLSSDSLTGTGLIQLASLSGQNVTLAPDPSLPQATIAPTISISTLGSYGGTIGSDSQSLTLLGPVTCPTGSLTIIGQNWTASSISVSNTGSLTLAGSFSSSVLPSVHHDGGTLTIYGSVSNADSTIDLAPLGNLTLGGSINGGTLTSSAGTPTLFTTAYGGSINGTTIDCDLNLSSAIKFSNGLTIAHNHTVSLPDTPHITGSGAITGSGTIVLNDTHGNTYGSISADSIGPGITLQTGINPFDDSNTISFGVPLLQGAVSVQTARTTLTLSAANWVNTGTLSVSAGTLALGGSFSPSSIGTIHQSGSGVVQITGTLNMPPGDDTLNLNASTGSFYFVSATVNGGTIRTQDNAAAIISTGTTTFNNVTLTGPINIQSKGVLTGNLLGTGQINFISGTLSAPSSSYTYSPSITISADHGSGSLGLAGQSITSQGPLVATNGGILLLAASNFTNAGSITASNGGVIGLNPPTFVNHGTIDLSGGGLELIGTSTTASYRALGLPPTPLYLAGTLDNTGDSLSSVPITVYSSATITGGTLTGSPDAPVTISAPTLNNVTLAGNISIPGYLLPTSTFIFAPASSVSLISPVADQAVIYWTPSDTAAGSVDISFDGNSSYGAVQTSSNVTLPTGLFIHTGTQGGTVGNLISPSSLTFNGTISAQTPGKSLTVAAAPLINHGTLQAINASTLLLSGQSPYPSTSNFTNSGLITTGPSSTVKITGPFINTGRVDFAGGTLILNYSGTSPIDTFRSQLLTGYNAGSWNAPTGFTSSAAASDPTLAVAYTEASDLLHLTGSQTATWSGQTVDATSLLFKLTLPGDANLDGQITPDDYALLDRSYNQHMTDPHWTDGDFNYDGVVDQQDYLLLDTTYLKAHGSAMGPLLSQRESQFGTPYITQLLTSLPDPSLSSILYPLSSLLLLPRRRNPGKNW